MVTPPSSDRDERILRHIGLYRITLRPVLSRLFFDGGNPGNVIQRLVAEGRIQARAGLPNRLSYYQLTVAEARARGLPEARARPPRGQALPAHLGTLWFCCVEGQGRTRLEHNELRQLFGNRFPNGPHCIEGGSVPKIVRVHTITPRASLSTAVRMLGRRIERFRESTVLGAWVRNRQYCIAILADEPGRVERLRRSLHERGLNRRAEIEVWYAPSPAGLPAAVQRLRAMQNDH